MWVSIFNTMMCFLSHTRAEQDTLPYIDSYQSFGAKR